MTDYLLNVSKWRCGGDNPERSDAQMGSGPTLMLNEQGYMCCLGQFALQKGVSRENLMMRANPYEVSSYMGYNYDNNVVEESECFGHTDLAKKLMIINDSEITSVRYKLARIRKLLESDDHTLTVINEEMLDEGHVG